MQTSDAAPRQTTTTSWRVVIPVKETRVGKSRLAAIGRGSRQALSHAIADDTVGAIVGALGADRVLLVTSDPGLRRSWTAQGVTLQEDPGGGLNAAVAAGLAALADQEGPVAAILGDLPALRPEDLVAALDAALAHRLSFVPDAAGTGTVLLARGAVAGPVTPRFGPGSAAAHAETGATRLELDLPRLRIDVDDDTSLAAAEALGVGLRTRSVLAGLRATTRSG